MKFKLDENLPAEAVGLLQSRGHDAATVGGQRLGGAPDSTVAAACRAEGRVLLSLDVDFADIRAYPPEHHAGLVVIRLARQDRTAVLDAVARAVRLLGTEPVTGRLWIVESDRVRILGD